MNKKEVLLAGLLATGAVEADASAKQPVHDTHKQTHEAKRGSRDLRQELAQTAKFVAETKTGGWITELVYKKAALGITTDAEAKKKIQEAIDEEVLNRLCTLIQNDDYQTTGQQLNKLAELAIISNNQIPEYARYATIRTGKTPEENDRVTELVKNAATESQEQNRIDTATANK